MQDRLPTATELARIQHTIHMLHQAEAHVQYRLQQNTEPTIHADNRRHAQEIQAGWLQLSQLISALSDNYFDKPLLYETTIMGLQLSQALIAQAHTLFP
jgi:hypothetical protein